MHIIAIQHSHTFLREGLGVLLRDEPSVSVAGTYASAAALVAACRDRHLDAAIVEADHGDIAATALHAAWPGVHVVRFGSAAGRTVPVLPIDAEPSELLAALLGVPRGEPVEPSPMDAGGRFAGAELLTPRQLEVLDHVSRGATARDVSKALGITVKTVEHHMHNAFVRIGAVNQAQAVARCLELGLLTGGTDRNVALS